MSHKKKMCMALFFEHKENRFLETRHISFVNFDNDNQSFYFFQIMKTTRSVDGKPMIGAMKKFKKKKN